MKTNLKKVQVIDLPDSPDNSTVYDLLPKNFSQEFYDERTDRNIGWITREEQEMLRNSKVGIAGCGGMGGLVAATLLRLGVGEIRIADTEVFDVSNLNRQFAATKGTIGKSKAFETAKMLRAITDDTRIIVYPQGIKEETVESFTSGCDVICDEIEFWAVAGRIILHETAGQFGVTIFNCNTVGFGTRLFAFSPGGKSMSELLGLSYQEAKDAERVLCNKTSDSKMVRTVMESVIHGLVPELPEYCLSDKRRAAILERLWSEGKASIIATNPPMASGFISDHILFFLLRNSATKRQLPKIPPIPGYLFFDAMKFEARSVCRQEVKSINSSKLTVGLVKRKIERRAAQDFINQKYTELFQATPPEAQHYFVAKKNDKILGTFSLDFCLEGEQIWLEQIYRFNHAVAPLPVERNKIVQYGRWITSIPGISESLIYAASVFAEKHDRLYGWCEHNDKVHKVAERLGIVFYPVPDAELLLENMPPATRDYYLRPPTMKLYMVDSAQIRRALETKINVLMEAGEICFTD